MKGRETPIIYSNGLYDGKLYENISITKRDRIRIRKNEQAKKEAWAYQQELLEYANNIRKGFHYATSRICRTTQTA